MSPRLYILYLVDKSRHNSEHVLAIIRIFLLSGFCIKSIQGCFTGRETSVQFDLQFSTN